MKKCTWVLADKSYCGEKVSYKMGDDGDEVGAAKVRKYNPFCDEHLAIHLQIEQLDEDELSEEEYVRQFNAIVGK